MEDRAERAVVAAIMEMGIESLNPDSYIALCDILIELCKVRPALKDFESQIEKG